MEFPMELGIGSFKVSAHLVFEVLAFSIGFRYFLYLRRRQNDPINEENRIWILIGGALGAFLGSRTVGALENPDALFTSANMLLHFYAHKTIVGGLLGGLFMVELTKAIIKEPSSSGDLFVFPLILAMIIGRIGCFSSGVHEDTFGEVTTFFMGMDLGDGLLRHPVTIYEIFFLLMLWVTVVFIEKRHFLPNGRRFQIFMVSYLCFRFILDFIKPGHTFIGGIGTIQISCLLGLMYYSIILLRSDRSLVKTPLHISKILRGQN